MSEFLEKSAKSGHMRECWRCGIEFDASDVLEGAPCPDCRLSLEPFEWRKLNVVAAEEELRRQALVKEMWEMRWPDNRIADSAGLTVRQVVTTRNKLGLAGHIFNGKELWGDEDAVLKKISEASLKYWSKPESRKPKNHGPAVAGNYGNDRTGRKKSEIDKRYGEK